MQSAKSFHIVLVTAPDLKTARALTRIVLEQRLAACVNLVPRLESHYWWQGKLEQGNEVLMVLKTSRSRLNALEKCLLSNHPYDTCEILALPLASGTKRYLKWLTESVAMPPAKDSK